MRVSNRKAALVPCKHKHRSQPRADSSQLLGGLIDPECAPLKLVTAELLASLASTALPRSGPKPELNV